MINLLYQSKPFTTQQLEQLKSWGYTPKQYNPEETIDYAWPEVISGSIDFDFSKPSQYSNLKLIQLHSAGYDKVSLEDAKNNNISVCNARGAYSIAIAEYVIWRILDVYKNVREYEQLQKDKVWTQSRRMFSLMNKRIAILGTGSIGQEIAKRFKPFHTHLTGFNTNGRSIDHFDETEQLNQLASLINTYDIVIIALPLNDDTKGLFNKELLLKMKPESTLVNIGRGQILVEQDLKEVIDHHLRAVVLDVFETEPLSEDSFLWSHPKAYITSHVSFNDDYTPTTRSAVIMENLRRYAQKEPLINVIV